MSARKRGLGRGLDALLSDPDAAASPTVDRAAGDQLAEIPVERIRRGRYQPRRDMDPDALEELAHSIRMQGVVQPIVVRAVEDAEVDYEIIAGERRWRAAAMAELATIPAVIREVPDQAALAIALIENIQREELNPIEEAHALHRLIEEFELTHHQVAEAVGRSRVAVTNLLRLMGLEEGARELVEMGALEMGHARALLALEGAEQVRAARDVAQRELTVRETEKLVRRLQEGAPEPAEPAREDPDVRRLQEDLSERLGAPVKVSQGRQGRGKVEIRYNSLDELEGILAHIK
ncbi:ParB/RepB/Spo0J family partition protein [Thiohalospira sp.]|uniref:ParB/RepB/Spo0J family partition protein n=1 Tax=Thiohalospira sp. TaxID=3080549 RepID=UPI003980EF59